jgi:DnaJ-domain-containing protein 1
MSIRRRLWNVMRSELSSLQERARDRLEGLRVDGFGSARGVDADVARSGGDEEQLRQYYANLEIKPGASMKEVKSAYRRLMRSYHPDRHADDPEKVRVANEVSQQLREAYEAIREELRKQGKAS